MLFEHADDFYAHIDDETRSNLQGVLLFNGLDHLSLKLGARFDSVRTLRQQIGDDAIIGMHENASPSKFTNPTNPLINSFLLQ